MRARLISTGFMLAALLFCVQMCFADGYVETTILYYGEYIMPDIMTLAVDDSGDVLIGTYNYGLYKYNGESCELVADYKGCGIPIRSIDFAPDRSLWIGGYAATGIGFRDYTGGISHFDGETWTYYQEESGLASDAIRTIAVDKDGVVWAGAEYYSWTNKTYYRGLTRYDGETWTIYDKSNGLTDNRIIDLAISNDGTLWVATGNGLSRFDGVKWEKLLEMNGETIGLVGSMEIDSNDHVWFTSSEGITKYDGLEFFTYSFDTIDSGHSLRNFAIDSEDKLWITCDKGLICFDGNSWDVVLEPDTDLQEDMRNITVGFDNVIWFYSHKHDNMKSETYQCLTRYDQYATSVADTSAEPSQTITISNSPNPFNPNTEIRYTLPCDGSIKIDIFNCLGQRVASLADRHMPAGNHSIVWNGTDSAGNPVSSGVYIARIGNEKSVVNHRMMLMR